MPKIIQARLQQYMNYELPDVQTIEKAKGTRNIANICWIIEKASEFKKKKKKSALLTIPKHLTVWITANWKILQEMVIPDHRTCLLKNLCAGQEATVRMNMEKQTGSK